MAEKTTNERLRNRIAACGLTYTQTAAKSGVSMSIIAEAIRRNYIPKPRLAYKLAQALDTTPEEIGLVKCATVEK